MKTNSYSGRLDLYRSVGCTVEGVARISVVKDDHICLQEVDVLGDIVDHLRVKIKNCMKGKGERVRFVAKVSMYARNTKVGLKDLVFL